MRKKAQGMSLNVIIIAALGLLVLVVLAIIFTGRTGVFVRESDKCDTKGGTCVETKDACTGTYDKVVWGACDLSGDGKFHFNNEDKDGYCCLSVGIQGAK
jgi:hypothetical protein